MCGTHFGTAEKLDDLTDCRGLVTWIRDTQMDTDGQNGAWPGTTVLQEALRGSERGLGLPWVHPAWVWVSWTHLRGHVLSSEQRRGLWAPTPPWTMASLYLTPLASDGAGPKGCSGLTSDPQLSGSLQDAFWSLCSTGAWSAAQGSLRLGVAALGESLKNSPVKMS